MILPSIQLLVDQLRKYISSTNELEEGLDSGADPFVILGNIAFADVPDLTPPIRQRIVLSLVNILEESTLKNNPSYERVGNGVRYRNAPVYLNIFLLFSANYDDYENALFRLSQVVEFFQGKRIFTLANSPMIQWDEKQREAFSDVRLLMDFYALSFEQINHLWGSLGGKQVPFVLYRMRLVKVQVNRTLEEGEVITEIKSKESIT